MSYVEQVVCIPKSLSNKNISLIGYRLIASLMVKSATAYNPFVYYFCSENFQATIKKAFTRKPNQPQTINIKMAIIPQPEPVQAPHFNELQELGIYSEAGVTDVDQHAQPLPQQDTMAKIEEWENDQARNEDFNQTGSWRGRGHGHGCGGSDSGGFYDERRSGDRGEDRREATMITVEIEVHAVEIEVHTMAIEESIVDVTSPMETVLIEETAVDCVEMDLDHPVTESTWEPHKAVWV